MDNGLGSGITPEQVRRHRVFGQPGGLDVTRGNHRRRRRAVAENSACTFLAPFEYPAWVTHSMHLGAPSRETFAERQPMPPRGDAVMCRVIEVLPGSVPDREVRARSP